MTWNNPTLTIFTAAEPTAQISDSRATLAKKVLVISLGLLLGSAWPESHADTLNLTINNIPSTEGRLLIEVINAESFDDAAPAVASFNLPAKTGSATLSTNTLPAGEYGIRVMHDLDNDGELATNLVGMPKEPWGFSNNATGSFGPPQWDDVKFQLDGSAEQTIDLIH